MATFILALELNADHYRAQSSTPDLPQLTAALQREIRAQLDKYDYAQLVLDMANFAETEPDWLIVYPQME
jgi:hypothetical protein